MRYITRSIVSDVLIVGGGLAALTAALEARKTGLDIILVSKGLIGRGGNTIVSGAGFASYLPGKSFDDSFEQFRIDSLGSGRGINHLNLLNIFVERSGEAILDLEKYGVRFFKIQGDYVRRTPPGHTKPRQIPSIFDKEPYRTRGLSITLPLIDAAKKCGIKFIEKTQIIRLLKDADGVRGAIGINRSTLEHVQIAAKAVVLATGGAGMIYEKTNNTSDMTGDGYALALDAGARLTDMEFVQFYPTMAFQPLIVPVSNPLFGDGAVLRNKLSERFLYKYDPAGDMATRDSMSRAIFSEIQSGNGINGGVYIDCRGVSSGILATRYKPFSKFLLAKGVDLKREMLVVSPTTHFFMGGVGIDENCWTKVPGLFAAGEIVGGLHGANRLSGNALTEAVVFGKIAGSMAASLAKKTNYVRFGSAKLDEPVGRERVELKEIKARLRRTMWEKASVVRSGDSLREGLAQILLCQKELSEATVENVIKLAEKSSLINMLTVAEVVARSALLRAESRGSHFRSDFPKEGGSRWVGNTEVIRKREKLHLKFIRK